MRCFSPPHVDAGDKGRDTHSCKKNLGTSVSSCPSPLIMTGRRTWKGCIPLPLVSNNLVVTLIKPPKNWDSNTSATPLFLAQNMAQEPFRTFRGVGGDMEDKRGPSVVSKRRPGRPSLSLSAGYVDISASVSMEGLNEDEVGWLRKRWAAFVLDEPCSAFPLP